MADDENNFGLFHLVFWLLLPVFALVGGLLNLFAAFFVFGAIGCMYIASCNGKFDEETEGCSALACVWLPVMCPTMLFSYLCYAMHWTVAAPSFLFGCARRVFARQFPENSASSCTDEWKVHDLSKAGKDAFCLKADELTYTSLDSCCDSLVAACTGSDSASTSQIIYKAKKIEEARRKNHTRKQYFFDGVGCQPSILFAALRSSKVGTFVVVPASYFEIEYPGLNYLLLVHESPLHIDHTYIFEEHGVFNVVPQEFMSTFNATTRHERLVYAVIKTQRRSSLEQLINNGFVNLLNDMERGLFTSTYTLTPLQVIRSKVRLVEMKYPTIFEQCVGSNLEVAVAFYIAVGKWGDDDDIKPYLGAPWIRLCRELAKTRPALTQVTTFAPAVLAESADKSLLDLILLAQSGLAKDESEFKQHRDNILVTFRVGFLKQHGLMNGPNMPSDESAARKMQYEQVQNNAALADPATVDQMSRVYAEIYPQPELDAGTTGEYDVLTLPNARQEPVYDLAGISSEYAVQEASRPVVEYDLAEPERDPLYAVPSQLDLPKTYDASKAMPGNVAGLLGESDTDQTEVASAPIYEQPAARVNPLFEVDGTADPNSTPHSIYAVPAEVSQLKRTITQKHRRPQPPPPANAEQTVIDFADFADFAETTT
eukprot:m.28870 g.28870  ORF g.28870 m.28870 type:complete len:655 (+) comp9082_c0_seq1:243-2207(+)